MSEEKRFIKNKKVIGLSISLVAMCVLSGVLGISFIMITGDYDDLSGDYDDLYIDYLELKYNFSKLNNDYFILTGEHTKLENDYDDLLDDYDTLQTSYDSLEIQFNALQIAYNYITDTIRQSILPVQYCIFAEAVRRYYMPLYLMDNMTDKEWYMGYAEFCRDMILHDSSQYNAFFDVSNAFSDALRFGNDTMYLAWYIMFWTFWDWLPYWDLDLTFDELWGIDVVVDWCIDEIDYEYDDDITDGQENSTWDYPKFPVETAFRTMGDCEDQAILCAAYLEPCGFETAIAIFHDPDHPTEGAFYHGVPLVHIEDTSAFWDLYPTTGLWRFSNVDPYYPEYTWCFLDPTWDVPFGSEPSWLDDYGGFISFSFCSIAFCDIDGAVGENIGLTYVMPTKN